MRFVYPKGNTKALTFSYDDGQEFDIRLVEIFNQYGMKGTFHLNSGTLGVHRGVDNYVEADMLKEIYNGHEIACHGVEHRNLPTITQQQAVLEIDGDRKALEALTGKLVRGMSYAFGNYDLEIKRIAASLGIQYARTVKDTNNFFPPEDFLEWNPTCHHGSSRLMELGDSFIKMAGYYELPVMYVWGHSFEFGRTGDWTIIEAFAEKMSGLEGTWYATNLEICCYIKAVRSQVFSADGTAMYNPCAASVWFWDKSGNLTEVKSGETVVVER